MSTLPAPDPTPTELLLLQYEDSVKSMMEPDAKYPHLKLDLNAYAQILRVGIAQRAAHHNNVIEHDFNSAQSNQLPNLWCPLY